MGTFTPQPPSDDWMPIAFSANSADARFHRFPTTQGAKASRSAQRRIGRMATKTVQGLDAVADTLIFAGQQVGLGVRDLVNLLEAGMNVEQLVDYLAAKLADRPVEN